MLQAEKERHLQLHTFTQSEVFLNNKFPLKKILSKGNKAKELTRLSAPKARFLKATFTNFTKNAHKVNEMA